MNDIREHSLQLLSLYCTCAGKLRYSEKINEQFFFDKKIPRHYC